MQVWSSLKNASVAMIDPKFLPLKLTAPWHAQETSLKSVVVVTE